MQFFLTTPEGRQGPMDEHEAIALCLSGRVSPDSYVEDYIPGGRRKFELARFPRLHQAAIVGQSSPGVMRFAECPACETEVFQSGEPTFACTQCGTAFIVDPEGQVRNVRRPTPRWAVVLLILAVASAIVVKTTTATPGMMVVRMLGALGISATMATLLVYGVRHGVLPTQGGLVSRRRRPFLFTTSIAMFGLFTILFVSIFVDALLSFFGKP